MSGENNDAAARWRDEEDEAEVRQNRRGKMNKGEAKKAKGRGGGADKVRWCRRQDEQVDMKA